MGNAHEFVDDLDHVFEMRNGEVRMIRAAAGALA